ncbi:MAG: S-layer homology domain-containing protein [Defluviitaleaceae bacterium]|nr:S-layer homology domain-containing protein [Defluviitaleaceae bacterium]
MKKRIFNGIVSFMLLFSFLIIYFPVVMVASPTITINHPSSIPSNRTLPIIAGENINFNFTTSSVSLLPDEELRWHVAMGPSWLTISQNGACSISPPSNAANDPSHHIQIEVHVYDTLTNQRANPATWGVFTFSIHVSSPAGSAHSINIGTNLAATLNTSMSHFNFPSAQVGYTTRPSQQFHIRNMGATITGLTVNIENSSAFEIQTLPTVTTFAAGATNTFTVRPVNGLLSGEHSAYAVLRNGSGAEVGRIRLVFDVGNVATPLVTISLPPHESHITEFTFPSAPIGYSVRPAQRFDIRNRGGALSNITAVITSGTGYFEMTGNPASSLAAASGTNVPSTHMSVRPRNNLPVGTHTGILTLRHTTSNVTIAEVNLIFTVGGTGTFPTLGTSTIDASTIRVDSAVVTINITSLGDGITESGVVFSRSSLNNRTLNRPSDAEFHSTIHHGNISGTRAFTLNDLRPGTRYYVAGFVRDRVTGNYIFESPATAFFTTMSESYLPRVITESASRISDSQLQVELTTQNRSTAAGQRITERGIVFSRNVSNPTLNNSDGHRVAVTAGPNSTVESSAVVTFTPPQPNQAYFVRAFARNDHGIAYGVTIRVPGFGTDGTGATWGGYISTNAPTNMTQTSVTLGGHVASGVNYRVVERGIVYSRSISMPEIHNSNRRTSSVTSSGSFSINLSNLERNARYFARAYIITDDRWNEPFYGNVISFTVGSSGYTNHQQWNTQGFVSGVILEGVPGHRFEPDRAVTRIEVARMIYNMRGRPFAGDGIRFNDMPHDTIDIEALRFVSARGYMLGYEGNLFRPHDPITRAEVVAVACRVYGYTRDHSGTPFTDIQGHWAQGYIVAANRNGFISGFPDRTFRPNSHMTRAEAVSMFSRSERRSLSHLGAAQFVDLPSTHWAYHFIMSTSVPRP